MYSYIGDESKKAREKFNSDKNEFYKKHKDFYRKLNDTESEEEELKLIKQYEKKHKGFNKKRESLSPAYSFSGKVYTTEYLNSYGKDITISMLKDLGYDDEGAKLIRKTLAKGRYVIE